MIDFRNTTPREYEGYQQALESEQRVRQLIVSVNESIAEIKQHQLDYGKDISLLEASLARIHQQATVELLARNKQFMKQLLQMERDKMRQHNNLNIRLNEAVQITQSKLSN